MSPMLSRGNVVAVFASKPEAQVLAARTRGTVVLSLGVNKGYCIIASLYHVTQSSVDSRLCLCELIDPNVARFAMDIDADIEPQLTEVEGYLVHLFHEVHGARVRVTWIFSDDPSGDGRRWHCIVAGAVFRDLWVQGCLATVAALRQRFPGFPCDLGLYRNGASLRMVGQDKFVDPVYTKRLRVYRRTKVSDLVVTAAEDDVPIVAPTPSPGLRTVSPPRVREQWSLDDVQGLIPRGLVLGRRTFAGHTVSTYRLDHVAPWHCPQCSRVHHRDNAYLRVTPNGATFQCFRARQCA